MAFKTGKKKYGYFCIECGVIGRHKDSVMDHCIPVVGKEGFTTLDDFAERLFCNEENWQNMCKPCHKLKSNEETAARKEHRKLNTLSKQIAFMVKENK